MSLLVPLRIRRTIRRLRGPTASRYLIGDVPPLSDVMEKPATLEAAIEQHIDRHWFPTITRSTRKNSITKGVEARAAFLDRDLAATIKERGTNGLFDGEGGKAMLRDAFGGQLPDRILDREKAGFVETRDHWYTPAVKQRFMDRFSAEGFGAGQYIDQEQVLNDLQNDQLPFAIAYRIYTLDRWLSLVADWQSEQSV